MTFTDDFSQKTWVYVLREKSAVFAAFKRFKARIENETGKSINTLRTDQGSEYC